MEKEVKKYVCVCGKEFDNSQAFNSHKGHCKVHLQQKYGSYEKYLQIHNKNHEHVGSKNSQRSKDRKEQELNQWISEQHTCEKCGKVMTEKYGSGRFCSRFCANSRNKSEETKNKISISVKNQQKIHRNEQLELKKQNYYNDPRKCIICNKIITFEHRNRQTCSKVCYKKCLTSIANKNNLGGITKGHGTGKGGKYKGIRCDSRYELIFLVYCLQTNMNIQRNLKFFNYIDQDGVQRKYYPDFYFPDTDTYVEIKGYFQENTQYKIKAMEEQRVNHKVLYWEDLKPCLQLIEDQFKLSYHTSHKLYDSD